jgi:hypothetical protein
MRVRAANVQAGVLTVVLRSGGLDAGFWGGLAGRFQWGRVDYFADYAKATADSSAALRNDNKKNGRGMTKKSVGG